MKIKAVCYLFLQNEVAAALAEAGQWIVLFYVFAAMKSARAVKWSFEGVPGIKLQVTTPN